MVTKNKKEAPKLDEFAVGFNSLIYNDKSFTVYDPDALRITKGSLIYRNMLYDDQIKACLNFKKAAVVARGYNFNIQGDGPEQEKMVDFFNAVLDEMTGSFTDKLKAMMTGFENGFSITEKVYKTITFDNKPYWGIKDLKSKPWDTFLFDTDKYGNITALKQTRQVGNETIIPMNKIIHWVYQPDVNQYYGESDLRACYRAWWSKDNVIKFQNIHLERFGSGFPIVTPQAEARIDEKIKAALISMISRISAKAGFYVPKHYKLEMIQPQQTDSYENAVAQHDKSIAKALLVPNLLGISEQGNTGSYAQSQTQFDCFLWVIEDICRSLAECLNEQLFSYLALYNFGTKTFPKFQFDPMTASKKESMAKTWAELLSKNAVTNSDRDEAFTRSLMGYPAKDHSIDSEPPADKNEPVTEYTFKAQASGSWLQRVDFKDIKKSMDSGEQEYMEKLNLELGRVRLAIENQIQKIAGGRSFGNIDLKEFEAVKIPKASLTSIRKITRNTLQSVLDENYNRAAKELPKKMFAARILGMDRSRADKFLASKSIKIAGVLENDILKAVGQILENGVKYDKTLKDIMLELDKDPKVILPSVDSIGRPVNMPARIANIARTNISDAVNQGRQSLFGSPELKGFIQAYEYSSILDENTSQLCESLNGKIRADWGELTPPNHYQCRSILVPVTSVDDWDQKESNIPSSLKPMDGFS